MFIHRAKQPALRLPFGVPTTPTFSENCVPKQKELTLIFITVLHMMLMNTVDYKLSVNEQ